MLPVTLYNPDVFRINLDISQMCPSVDNILTKRRRELGVPPFGVYAKMPFSEKDTKQMLPQ